MMIPDCHDPDSLSSPPGVGCLKMLKSFCCNVFAATQVAGRYSGYVAPVFAGSAIAACTVEPTHDASNSVLLIAVISNLLKEDWIIVIVNESIASDYRAA